MLYTLSIVLVVLKLLGILNLSWIKVLAPAAVCFVIRFVYEVGKGMPKSK